MARLPRLKSVESERPALVDMELEAELIADMATDAAARAACADLSPGDLVNLVAAGTLRALRAAESAGAPLGPPLDPAIVLAHVRADERAIVTAAAVDSLLDLSVCPVNAAWKLSQVRSLATRRRLRVLGNTLERTAETDEDAPEIVARHMRELEELQARCTPRPASRGRLVADVIRGDAYSRPRRKFLTGLPELDAALGGGLNSRQQSIIAAPTGVGKTGLSGTMMLGLAQQAQPVLWVCTELDAEEQAARFAALAMRKAHGGSVTPDDLLRHYHRPDVTARVLDGLPLYLLRMRRRDGDPFVAIGEALAEIQRKHGVAAIVVVDYLQKLAVEDVEHRRLAVSHVSERLLDTAQDHDTHVMSISSVSRSFYNKTARRLRKQGEGEDPRDWLAVGKESGDLEYDAAHLMFLDVGDDADMVGERPARLIVAKARGGGEGFYGLKFHGPSGLFRPSPEAAKDLAPPTKFDTKADAERRVLSYVTAHQVDAPTKTDLRDLIDGVRGTEVDRAVDSLVDKGELSYSDRTYANAAGSKRKKKVLVLPKDVHAG